MIAISILAISGCTRNGGDVRSENNSKNGSSGQMDNPISIHINVADAMPISKELREKTVIRLEENDNIIGVPQSMVILGDTIYAIDSFQNPGFYAYLHNGKQIFNYCLRGGGPEDISSLFCLAINDSVISAFDVPSSSLVFIDKKGHYVERIPMSVMVTGAMQDNSGGLWIDYSNQKYSTTKLSWKKDPDAEEIEVIKVPEYLKGMTKIGLQTFSRLDDGTINYLPSLEPRIYSLYEGKARLKYELDFGNLWPDEDTMKREYQGNSWARKMNKFPIQSLNAVENGSYLVVSFNYNQSRHIFVYEKKNSQGEIFIDDTNQFYAPEAVFENQLYIPKKDDTIGVVNIQD